MERAIGYNAYKLDRDSNFFAKQLAAANWQKSEKAIMWAVENGITKGTTDTTFSPNAVCTRAQIVVFLYRASGDDASNLKLRFTDVPANVWCAEAVAWGGFQRHNQRNHGNDIQPERYLHPCTGGNLHLSRSVRSAKTRTSGTICAGCSFLMDNFCGFCYI